MKISTINNTSCNKGLYICCYTCTLYDKTSYNVEGASLYALDVLYICITKEFKSLSMVSVFSNSHSIANKATPGTGNIIM